MYGVQAVWIKPWENNTWWISCENPRAEHLERVTFPYSVCSVLIKVNILAVKKRFSVRLPFHSCLHWASICTMMTSSIGNISALLVLCAGNSIHRSAVNSPHKGQWRGALMFLLICARTNGWVNNRDAGDLRRYRAHYDVTVMGIR